MVARGWKIRCHLRPRRTGRHRPSPAARAPGNAEKVPLRRNTLWCVSSVVVTVPPPNGTRKRNLGRSEQP